MHRAMRTMSGLVASIVLAACSQSVTTDAMLFEAASFVPTASDATLLSSQEREAIRARREDRFTKQVIVVGFNSEALKSSEISLEMPDRRLYHFDGVVAPAVGMRGYSTWRGSAAPATASAEVATSTAQGNGAFLANSLELFFDNGQKYVLGKLSIENRSFQLTSLNARYMALQENGLNSSSLPIDAEPPGPMPRRQPNADWPRGRLTEKLRESLTSSSIGAWLSPAHCNRIATCGEVTKIACDGTRDGPEMYFNNASGKLIMACGGACMRGPGLPGSKLCTACPPPEWKTCSRDGG